MKKTNKQTKFEGQGKGEENTISDSFWNENDENLTISCEKTLIGRIT